MIAFERPPKFGLDAIGGSQMPGRRARMSVHTPNKISPVTWGGSTSISAYRRTTVFEDRKLAMQGLGNSVMGANHLGLRYSIPTSIMAMR